MYTLALWDTAGQPDYQKLRVLSYPGAQVFILCFSICDWPSFENVSTIWYPEICMHCPNAAILLLGTKLDLREDLSTIERLAASNLQSITFEQGLQKSRKIKAVQYLECSALTQQGLLDVFKQVAICATGRSTERKKKKKCIIM